MTTETYYFDEGSRLAGETRKAKAAVDHLDRCGHTVLTVDAEAAQAALDAAKAAEAAYWAPALVGK